MRSVPWIVVRVRPGKHRSARRDSLTLDRRNHRCHTLISAVLVKRAQATLHGQLPVPFGLSRLIFRRLTPGVRRADVSGKVFVALQHEVPCDLLRRLVLRWFPWPKYPAALRTAEKSRLYLPYQLARHGLVYACHPTRRKHAVRRRPTPPSAALDEPEALGYSCQFRAAIWRLTRLASLGVKSRRSFLRTG